MSDPILMGYEDVSELLGVPVNTLKDYHNKGKDGPPSAVVFGKVRYKRADVFAWIDGQFNKPRESKPNPVFTPLGRRRSLTNA